MARVGVRLFTESVFLRRCLKSNLTLARSAGTHSLYCISRTIYFQGGASKGDYICRPVTTPPNKVIIHFPFTKYKVPYVQQETFGGCTQDTHSPSFDHC